VTEAGKLHSSSPKPTAQQQVPRHYTNEDAPTRREIDGLKAQIKELEQQQAKTSRATSVRD
jgi:hypothetical protein